jgi:hypothetical protein
MSDLNWNLLCRRVASNCTHQAELAHDATEKQRHPDEAAPKQTRRATTTEGGEEARHAHDEENETDRCNDRTCDAQEGACLLVFGVCSLLIDLSASSRPNDPIATATRDPWIATGARWPGSLQD